jgi:hypothetical protein
LGQTVPAEDEKSASLPLDRPFYGAFSKKHFTTSRLIRVGTVFAEHINED